MRLKTVLFSLGALGAAAAAIFATRQAVNQNNLTQEVSWRLNALADSVNPNPPFFLNLKEFDKALANYIVRYEGKLGNGNTAVLQRLAGNNFWRSAMAMIIKGAAIPYNFCNSGSKQIIAYCLAAQQMNDDQLAAAANLGMGDTVKAARTARLLLVGGGVQNKVELVDADRETAPLEVIAANIVSVATATPIAPAQYNAFVNSGVQQKLKNRF